LIITVNEFNVFSIRKQQGKYIMNPSPTRTQAQKEAEALLMLRVASGDKQAIVELYDKFGGLIFLIAHQWQQTNPKTDPERAVEEVFVVLWREAKNYDPQMALETVAIRTARRYLQATYPGPNNATARQTALAKGREETAKLNSGLRGHGRSVWELWSRFYQFLTAERL
jgi:hypothetical protein